MTDEVPGQPPAWWVVDRRAAREAERQAKREQRVARRDARDARREARRGPPVREPVTPERIADAALALIDAHGIEGLTVRTLAEALGVGTMTLYWYVRNKDEVLELLADRLLAGTAPTALAGDWRDAVRGMASGVRQALLRHPRAVPLIASRGSFGPNGIALAEASLAAFAAAGFSPDEAAGAYLTVSFYVTGFCLWETSGSGVGGAPSGGAGQADAAANYARMLPADRYPNLVAAADRARLRGRPPWLFGTTSDEGFAFGLEILIEGLAAQRSRAAAS